jgi:hypothetical protein
MGVSGQRHAPSERTEWPKIRSETGVLYRSQSNQAPERRSGLRPSKKEPERRSGAFRHKNTPTHKYNETNAPTTTVFTMHDYYVLLVHYRSAGGDPWKNRAM